MKTKLASILLIISSAFMFTSCGDSQDKVVDDMIELIEETPEVMKSGDKDKIAAHTKKMEELEKRAEALGMDPKSDDVFTEDQKMRIDEATKKASADMRN